MLYLLIQNLKFVTLVCKHTGFTFNHFDTLTSFKKMLKDPAFNNSFDILKRVLIPKIGNDGELGLDSIL